jgi:hypothetical protein
MSIKALGRGGSMKAGLVKDLIDLPVRRMTVAAGRETIGFITEYRKRRFAAELV